MNNVNANYTDGTAIFLGHQGGGQAARQAGATSHSQGPGGSSHKTLYATKQDRLHEIGKVYNYH